MEKDLGLAQLPEAQKTIVIAMNDLCQQEDQVITTDEIRAHRIVQPLTAPTFHRAMRSLVDAGVLTLANGARAKHYLLDLSALKNGL